MTQVNLSAPSYVFSSRRIISQKGSRHRRKIGTNSLWLYSYSTQTLPSKNKNINYIFYISMNFSLFVQWFITAPKYMHQGWEEPIMPHLTVLNMLTLIRIQAITICIHMYIDILHQEKICMTAPKFVHPHACVTSYLIAKGLRNERIKIKKFVWTTERVHYSLIWFLCFNGISNLMG